MTKKYRPYLTLPELRHITELLRSTEPTSSLSRYFARYLLEVDSGYRTANHIAKPSIEQKLGIDKEILTTHESEQRHRYENDQMTPQEEYEYEVSQGLHR